MAKKGSPFLHSRNIRPLRETDTQRVVLELSAKQEARIPTAIRPLRETDTQRVVLKLSTKQEARNLAMP